MVGSIAAKNGRFSQFWWGRSRDRVARVAVDHVSYVNKEELR